jgi:hypothetical protein
VKQQDRDAVELKKAQEQANEKLNLRRQVCLFQMFLLLIYCDFFTGRHSRTKGKKGSD